MIGRVNTGGGGAGGTLTVTAPAGVAVEVSKDGKTKRKTANADGLAVFKGLATGTWMVTITDGTQTSTRQVTINADYSVTIAFFHATISVTYPAGSTCTCTDGTTTLVAPDTSGTWACVVPNAGDWVVSLDIGFKETVTVVASGEVHTVDRWYLYKYGDEREYLTGGFSISGYANPPFLPAEPIKNSDNIYIYGVGNNQAALAGTQKKIPLVGFNRLVVDQNTTSIGVYAGINFGLSYEVRANKTSGVMATIHKNVVGRKNASVDISSADSDGYVVFYAQNIGGAEGYIYQAWLEV